MGPILVPTDFSEFANYAMDAAISIAQKSGKPVQFLHGISAGDEWRKAPNGKEEKYPEIKARIDKAEEALQEKIDFAAEHGVTASKLIVFLEEYKSIASAILSVPGSLIVMGSQGYGAFKKFIAGSNTSKVLGAAQQPVLVVKKPMPIPCEFRTIVFASDLDKDTHDAFDLLLRFGKSVGAENFHLVEVTTPHNFQPTGIIRANMEDYIAQHEYHSIWLHHYNHYTVEAGIAEFAKRIDADLIAIANHGRGDISSLFIESIPENLIKYADYPILSIRV